MRLSRYIPPGAARKITGHDLRPPRDGPCMCGHRGVWLRGRNTERAGSLEATWIAEGPRRFSRTPQSISAHRFAFVDRVLQLRRK